jgi:20S proteasome subunit beta 6
MSICRNLFQTKIHRRAAGHHEMFGEAEKDHLSAYGTPLVATGRAEHRAMENKQTRGLHRQGNGESFDPYADNSGTTLCLKQSDFIVVAADTRHSAEMTINSRKMSKIFRLKGFLLTTSGFYADGYELYIKMLYEIRMYEINGAITIHSAAHLLSKILYSKRFFPYYSFCCLSGFHEGRPYIYSYDPLGCMESVSCMCNGSGAPMIQPLLDSFIDKKNWANALDGPLDEEKAVELVIKAFSSAAERDIKTKDLLEIYVVREEGIRAETFQLRRD